MDVIERITEIEQHFQNLTKEGFEENLKKAGHGLIEPASKSGFEMIWSTNLMSSACFWTNRIVGL